MANLGCSKHTAYVQSKCNGSKLCELECSNIEYTRRLNEISEATVTVPISGTVDSPCCTCVRDIEPWCHQLTIVREGDGVVWTGPVQKIDYGQDEVVITASDKLIWLKYRVNELTLCYSPPPPTPPLPTGCDNITIPCCPAATSYTQIAEDIMILAMAEEDSACFLEDAQGQSLIIDMGDGLPPTEDRTAVIESFAGPTAYEDLLTISDRGMDFTVINHNVILMPETLPVSPIGILTDEMILGDVHIIKDGTIMANRVYVRYTNDDDPVTTCIPQCEAACGCTCSLCNDTITDDCYTNPCPAAETGDFRCYGLVERVISDSGAPTLDTARGVAERVLAQGEIAPRLIELPSGTKLAPETPWGINEMICGQRIDVSISKLCFPLFQSFQLKAVNVTDDGTDETIAVDLIALNQTTS